MSKRARAKEARLTHEIASRAIRRLDVLEWMILAGAVILSLVGGALVAGLLAASVGLPFRPTLVVASLLFFGVPSVIALKRMRNIEREVSAKTQELLERHDG